MAHFIGNQGVDSPLAQLPPAPAEGVILAVIAAFSLQMAEELVVVTVVLPRGVGKGVHKAADPAAGGQRLERGAADQQ